MNIPMELVSLILLVCGVGILVTIGLLLLFVHRVERQLADRANQLLRQGAGLEQIQQQFVSEGVDLQTAAKVVRRVEKRAIAASAPELLSGGASAEQVREQLTARGLDRETAADVVAAAARSSWVRSHRFAGIALGMPLLLMGVAAFVGAMILLFAVKAGLLVPFLVGPEDFREVADNDFDRTVYVVQESIRDELGKFAMVVVAFVGILFVAGAIALAGWRVALRFGVVTVVAGIGMLAFGVIYSTEPSLRFYAPLGFFVSLAGAMVVWGGLQYSGVGRDDQIPDNDARDAAIDACSPEGPPDGLLDTDRNPIERPADKR